MDNLGIPSEVAARLGVFAAIFITMALLEIALPRRELRFAKGRRWATNWTIVLINTVMVRLVFPAAAVGPALYAQANGIGLFNWIDAPIWLAVIVSFVALDFAVWLMHLVAHKWPLLWRVHRMHHADPDIDVSTAIRFHPMEIVLSMGWKAVVVVLLGAPAMAVLVFEMVLNGGAMFNHANMRLPLGLDRLLRWLIVTPDMHRIHHSIHRTEADSNYGFNLSIWDRAFRTYTVDPSDGHDGMDIGLSDCQNDNPTKLGWTLSIPFISLGKTSS